MIKKRGIVASVKGSRLSFKNMRHKFVLIQQGQQGSIGPVGTRGEDGAQVRPRRERRRGGASQRVILQKEARRGGGGISFIPILEITN